MISVPDVSVFTCLSLFHSRKNANNEIGRCNRNRREILSPTIGASSKMLDEILEYKMIIKWFRTVSLIHSRWHHCLCIPWTWPPPRITDFNYVIIDRNFNEWNGTWNIDMEQLIFSIVLAMIYRGIQILIHLIFKV